MPRTQSSGLLGKIEEPTPGTAPPATSSAAPKYHYPGRGTSGYSASLVQKPNAGASATGVGVAVRLNAGEGELERRDECLVDERLKRRRSWRVGFGGLVGAGARGRRERGGDDRAGDDAAEDARAERPLDRPMRCAVTGSRRLDAAARRAAVEREVADQIEELVTRRLVLAAERGSRDERGRLVEHDRRVAEIVRLGEGATGGAEREHFAAPGERPRRRDPRRKVVWLASPRRTLHADRRRKRDLDRELDAGAGLEEIHGLADLDPLRALDHEGRPGKAMHRCSSAPRRTSRRLRRGEAARRLR